MNRSSCKPGPLAQRSLRPLQAAAPGCLWSRGVSMRPSRSRWRGGRRAGGWPSRRSAARPRARRSRGPAQRSRCASASPVRPPSDPPLPCSAHAVNTDQAASESPLRLHQRRARAPVQLHHDAAQQAAVQRICIGACVHSCCAQASAPCKLLSHGLQQYKRSCCLQLWL